MPRMIIATLLTAGLPLVANAQANSQESALTNKAATKNTRLVKRQANASKGFRISLLMPPSSAKAKGSALGSTVEVSEEGSDRIGLGLGYASLPVGGLGFTTNLNYSQLKVSNTTIGLYRIDGNLAYAFSSNIYLAGGINLSQNNQKVTYNVSTSANGTAYGEETMDPGLGYQAGLGLQFTRNFGLDLRYVDMNQSKKLNKSGVSLEYESKFSGLEIGLTGTF